MRSGSPANLDIWTIEIARNLRNRVTSDAQPEGWPVWSPDGTRLVFGRGSSGLEGRPEKFRLERFRLVHSTVAVVLLRATRGGHGTVFDGSAGAGRAGVGCER